MMDKQVVSAMGATLQLSPGEPWPAEGIQPGSVNETATGTTASSTPSSITTSTPSPGPIAHHKLSSGAIAGITIGAASVVLLCAALFYFVGRSNTYHSIVKHQKGSDRSIPQQRKSPTTTWSPLSLSPNNPPGTFDAHYSGQTLSQSPPLPRGMFVGFNRQTGAPEFVTEAPIPSEKAIESRLSHPAFGRNSRQSTTYELPGEAPVVAEVGPYK